MRSELPEHEVSTGARPVGAPDTSPVVAAENVRGMFDSIAGRYDLLNHLLSAGIDRFWWWRAARAFRQTLRRADARVLDHCCGTGDMSLALSRRRPSTPSTHPILAVDFSHGMLIRGARKFTDQNILAVEADALHLPVVDGALDLISSAFGFRNLVDYQAGLRELFRVLRSGGQIGILDCNQPDGLLGGLYNLYFGRVLPAIGGMLSSSSAYQYLPSSVARFPRPPRMLQMIREAGFRDATWTSYTWGIAGLYRATKP